MGVKWQEMPMAKFDKNKPLLFAAIVLAALAVFAYREKIFALFYVPAEVPEAPIAETVRPDSSGAENEKAGGENAIEIVATNLRIPWEIAFLPDGELLVTERPGTLRKIGKKNRVYTIEGVRHAGEGGLLGMALHPRFTENHFLYLYLTAAENGRLVNRVARYKFENDVLSFDRIILDGIPGANVHDGGRIEFDPVSAKATAGKPNFYLYVTTGDAGARGSAQNVNSLAGKILRVNDDGSAPPGNPFKNPVWSYGHRNAQGLTWDAEGRLWATEHGRSGVLSGFDELNLIEKGKNYGWPVIEGGAKRTGMETPVAHSGADYAWAPGDIEFINGSLFFGGLRGVALYEVEFANGSTPKIKTHFPGEFGRIRVARLGPDGYLYIATSNTDGRGTPSLDDDKIIRVNAKVLAD